MARPGIAIAGRPHAEPSGPLPYRPGTDAARLARRTGAATPALLSRFSVAWPTRALGGAAFHPAARRDPVRGRPPSARAVAGSFRHALQHLPRLGTQSRIPRTGPGPASGFLLAGARARRH